MTDVIENPAPLQPDYLPENFVNREEEKTALQAAFSNPSKTSLRNLHLYGPRGTGKTHLLRSILKELPDRVQVCYIPCQRCDTQYKALKQIYQVLTREKINNGYHTSDLQREIENRVGQLPTAIILDEIEFALLNDGGSLLYFLSRLDNTENLSIITVSANHEELPVEERTKSSLQTQRIEFTRYTGETVYEILLERAQDALTSRSLEQEALTYIASTTSNTSLGLTWLKTAAQQAEQNITEEHTQELQSAAYRNYVDQLLGSFTEHHKRIYQAIQELHEEHDTEAIRSGAIYTRYQELSTTYNEDSLSNRRISDYLKHLELLNLIEADYHYGGKWGKTREILLRTH